VLAGIGLSTGERQRYDGVTIMALSNRKFRMISWIAIVAVCASVFVPVASHVLAAWSGSSSPWDEICSSIGIKRQSSAAANAGSELPASPVTLDQDGQCPYCLPSANPAAVPSKPASVTPTAGDGTSRFLFFFISTAPAAFVWDAAHPRAPPVAS
jgi:hypothetical protein